MLRIITHPAFRLGFLDAQAGRPMNHDRIVTRIESETPAGALQRIGWWAFGRFDEGGLLEHGIGAGTTIHDKNQARAALAQYRYEEGRLLHLVYGARCKSWGHPDFPPAQVYRLCERLAAERALPDVDPSTTR